LLGWKKDKPIFISEPNRCHGCPIEMIFAGGIPVGFKVGNACHKAQEDYDVTYSLNDFGQTICRVYGKIKGMA